MTGRRDDCPAVCGAHTLSTRQSSLAGLGSNQIGKSSLSCGDWSPSLIAFRIPLQARTGCGGKNRFVPPVDAP